MADELLERAMHRESIYVCTYSSGAEKVVGRVRAWDGREAAQLFALELEAEQSDRRVVPRDVSVQASARSVGARRSRTPSKR
jgi:hypothetical protein